MDVMVEHRSGYTCVRPSGAPTLGEFLAFIDVIASDSVDWPTRRLLVDMRAIETIQAFTEQFAIGEAAARKLKHLERVASVVPEHRITRTSEKAARHTGLDLRVFVSEQEAESWVVS